MLGDGGRYLQRIVVRRPTIIYLMISTMWIAVSLALLQIPEFAPSVVPSGTVAILGESEYKPSMFASLPFRGFATLSIFAVPTHVFATCLALKGLWKWAFGILVPTFLLAFWNHYAKYGPSALRFWDFVQIGVILNGCGFLMVNTLFSIPNWLYLEHSRWKDGIQTDE